MIDKLYRDVYSLHNDLWEVSIKPHPSFQASCNNTDISLKLKRNVKASLTFMNCKTLQNVITIKIIVNINKCNFFLLCKVF